MTASSRQRTLSDSTTEVVDTCEVPVSTVEEIKAAIEQLPADQLARLSDWLWEHSERLWDEQIERDEQDGRLDDLINQEQKEHRARRTRPQ